MFDSADRRGYVVADDHDEAVAGVDDDDETKVQN